MRAKEPVETGYAVNDGVRTYYEVFGSGATTVLLLPTWAIVDSRVWKLQVPYLARHFRVIAFDPRGNGRSDRPLDPAAHADARLATDALAVLDATDTARAVMVGLSMGARVLLLLAADHPDRVAGAVFVAPTVFLAGSSPRCMVQRFDAPWVSDEGWGRYNGEYWRRDLRGFAEFFFAEIFTEPHSSKQIEDGVEWTLQTDADTLMATEGADYLGSTDAGGAVAAEVVAARVRCPSLVVHGDDDRVTDIAAGIELARLLRCPIEVFAGGGHCVHARHPVRFNALVRQFVDAAVSR